MRFQNASVALETCRFRKVSPFLCGQFLIWTCAPNSSHGSCLEVGDRLSFIYLFHSMSLISGDVVLDDSEMSWVSADLVTDIDPVPPYCR
jgi:hypothetical protein